MTSQQTSARSDRAESLPHDAITVNLVRLAGLPKDKARECEAIVRKVLATHCAPQPRELPEDPIALLDLVRQNYTRDDDLPDDLLPRIDAVIAAAAPADHFPDAKEMIGATPATGPLLMPTSRDRCGSGFEQERPTPPFAPEPTDHRDSELRWPETPQDVKDMIGSSFTAAKFVNQGDQIGTHAIPAHEMDTYTVTAHDLLEAFSHWRDFLAVDTRAAGERMRGLAEWLRSHAEHGFLAPETREALKSWAVEVDAARREVHVGDANEMVCGSQPEPTVELHVPVPLSEKTRSKLLDGVCSLVTRHDVPVERVRLVAVHDGLAMGRPVADEAAKCPLAIGWMAETMAMVDEHGAALASGSTFVAQAKREALRKRLMDTRSAPANGLAALNDAQLRDVLMEAIDATMTRCRVSWSHWRNWPGTWAFATDLVPVVRKLAGS